MIQLFRKYGACLASTLFGLYPDTYETDGNEEGWISAGFACRLGCGEQNQWRGDARWMKSEVLALAGGLIILHRHGWSMGEMGNSLVPIERAMYNSLT